MFSQALGEIQMAKNQNNIPDVQTQMSLLNDADTYNKNIALAGPFGLTELSLRKQRALNTIQRTVQEQFFLRNPDIESFDDFATQVTEQYVENTNTVFEVSDEQIMAAMGYKDKSKYNSYTQILALFEEISEETIGFDALGIARSKTQKDMWVGFTKILGSVERKGGRFRLSIPPKMVHQIVNPEVSFKGRVDWTLYKSRNSPGIYETCEIFFQDGRTETDWFDVEAIRRLTGAMSKTYDNVAKLKANVIETALSDINTNDGLPLHIEVESTSMGPLFDAWEARNAETKGRAGRKPVTHFRFKFRLKPKAIIQENAIANQIKLTSQKMELRSLGIASNQVDLVLDECRDDQGMIIMRYLSWCIRQGHQLKKLARFKNTDSNQFGGYFRKHVIRDSKEEWLNIEQLLVDHLHCTKPDFDVNTEAGGQLVSTLQNSLMSSIMKTFLANLSEEAFAHLKSDFADFLEENFPDKFEAYQRGEYANSLMDMAEVRMTSYHFRFYLDFSCHIFSFEAYQYALLNEDKQLTLSIDTAK